MCDTGALSGWRWVYTGDSKARISGEHPHKPGMRYTHTIIEDWTPARTKRMAAVMCAAPEMLAALESCHEAARLMCDPEHLLAEYRDSIPWRKLADKAAAAIAMANMQDESR